MTLVKLGDVAEFINGAVFKPEDWGDVGRRIIRIQNLNDPTKPFNFTMKEVDTRYLVPPGTLLVSWSASLGVFEWRETDTALLNQHIFKVVPDTKHVRQDYLRHMLVKALEDMSKHHRGSTMVHVNRGDFLGTEIPLPPLEEQKRIAAILDQADALRRLRARALDRLNALGQAIFHEMFGDVSRNKKNFPVGTVEDLTESTQYGTSAKAGPTGAFAILRMNNLTYDGRMDLSSLKYIDLDDGDISKYTVVSGDLLFNRTNSAELVGKTAVYRGSSPLAFAGYLVRLRANKRGHTDYISAVLNSEYGKATLRGMCKSIIGMANINAKELRTIALPIPPISLQNEFAAQLARVEETRPKLEAARTACEALFTSLQQRAFRGEF